MLSEDRRIAIAVAIDAAEKVVELLKSASAGADAAVSNTSVEDYLRAATRKIEVTATAVRKAF